MKYVFYGLILVVAWSINVHLHDIDRNVQRQCDIHDQGK